MLKWILTAVAMLGLVVFFGGGIYQQPQGTSHSFQVEKPTFAGVTAQAQETGVNFLQQEAGMAAYVHIDTTLSLDDLEGIFKTVETASDNYIIGELPLSDLPNYAHPHLYVNTEGWVVAYYTNSEPASKMIQWIGYEGNSMPGTTLGEAIKKVYDQIQQPYPQSISYYNFEYPDANRVMLMTQLNHKDDNSSARLDKAFFLTIPSEIELFEISWSLYRAGQGDGDLFLDDRQLHEIGGSGLAYGEITSMIKVETRHRLNVRNDYTGTNAAIVLLYRTGP